MSTSSVGSLAVVSGDGLDVDGVEDAQTPQARLCAVHVAHREDAPLAEGDTFGHELMAQARGLHLDQGAARGGDSVGSASAFVAEHCHGHIAREVTLQQDSRRIFGHLQTEVDLHGVGYGVGQIFDEFRTEKVVAAVAQRVGDTCADHTQRVGGVALAAHQIRILCRQRVDQMIQMARVGQQLDGVETVGRSGGDGVCDFGFPGVLLVENLVAGAAAEVAVVVENFVEHAGAQVGAHVADEHRLGHELFV